MTSVAKLAPPALSPLDLALLQLDLHAPFVAGHGFTRAELAWLAARGDLRRVLEDVYLPAAAWQHRLARAAAFAALLPPRVIVGFESAAWIWGGPLMHTATAITAHGGAAMLRSATIRVVQQRRPPVMVRLHPAPGVSLKVTTPARTLLDLIKAGRGVGAAARFLKATAVPDSELHALLIQDANTPGIACARDYLNPVSTPAQRCR